MAIYHLRPLMKKFIISSVRNPSLPLEFIFKSPNIIFNFHIEKFCNINFYIKNKLYKQWSWCLKSRSFLILYYNCFHQEKNNPCIKQSILDFLNFFSYAKVFKRISRINVFMVLSSKSLSLLSNFWNWPIKYLCIISIVFLKYIEAT